jgi:thiol-disulfide isomerase/thioredoxin
MKVSKLLIAAVLVIAIGSPIAGFVGHIKLPLSTTPMGEPVAFFHGLGTGPAANQSGLASLERADAWLNSPPLTASALRGNVVLVHFWTYTCINWLRTQSYLRAWAEKYKDKALVVIGVHTPVSALRRTSTTSAGRLRRFGSIIPLSSTASMSFGGPSTTIIGQHCISSMRRGASGTLISARARTNNRRWSFSACSPKRASAASAMT